MFVARFSIGPGTDGRSYVSCLLPLLAWPIASTALGMIPQHQALATTQAGSHVVLCHHTNTERGYLSAVLKDKLREELNAQEGQEGWEVVVSEKDRDPLLIV